jgi:hypothetical protein
MEILLRRYPGRKASFTALILAVALCSPSTSSTNDKPLKATVPLSADEVAIYRAVLQQYSSKDAGSLHVSITAYPLSPDSPGLTTPDCLKGIQLESLSMVSHSFHDLPPDVLTGRGMMLVDPKKQTKIVHGNDPSNTIGKGKSVENAVGDAFATALFSMSEISFDKGHHFGVVSYHFWCGSLCGNGSTIVFEKINGVWKNANRNCGGWVS